MFHKVQNKDKLINQSGYCLMLAEYVSVVTVKKMIAIYFYFSVYMIFIYFIYFFS